jgi:hypothetical protein
LYVFDDKLVQSKTYSLYLSENLRSKDNLNYELGITNYENSNKHWYAHGRLPRAAHYLDEVFNLVEVCQAVRLRQILARSHGSVAVH